MPTYDEAKQMHKSAEEAKRLNAERLRRLKYNPDGSLKKKPKKKKEGEIKRIPVIPYEGREMNKVVDES